MDHWYHPILNCRDSLAWERSLFQSDADLASIAMEQAGRALGQAILGSVKPRIVRNPKVLLILGKGHNAGDALIACDELMKALPGLEVDLLPMMGSDSFGSAVLPWYQRLCQCANVRELMEDFRPDQLADSYGLSIDGVFGMQFRPPLRESFVERFAFINEACIEVRIAVDLPSGVSDHPAGQVLRADFTYATGIFKEPLVNHENQPHCGRIRYLDIGFFHKREDLTCVGVDQVIAPSVFKQSRALRSVSVDKRSFGHLLIVAGSRTMPGALLMSVRSALSSGVGLVTVVCPESVAPIYSAQAPEAMWLPWAETPDGGLAMEGLLSLQSLRSKITAVLMGPGVGREAESQALLDGVGELFDVPFILDADALQSERVITLSRSGKSLVLTPHMGEFLRIAGLESRQNVSRDEFLAFEKKTQAILVLKSTLTRIVYQGKQYMSPYGNPILARGGSGDLLAGIIAGKVANPQISDLLEAVASGVVIHGRAADRLAATKDENHVHTTELLDYYSLL